MGQIGMSVSEVFDLDFEEFGVIHSAWLEHHETLYRDRWEQTRFLAQCLLSPHSKKRLSPTDIVRFPWENPEHKTMTVTTEDIERIKKRFGV